MKVLLLLALVLATRAEESSPEVQCKSVMEEAGLSKGFPINVAHRLHSLTLEDLRYYFDPEAPEDNTIPTVNFNLTKNAQRVLPNTPLFGFDSDFATQAMKHLDQVLRNMDKPNFGITNYSVLEQIAHVTHMAELWNSAKKYYEMLEEQAPSDELCGCVNDMDENGVLSELELLALKIKYPGLTSGRPEVPYGQPKGLAPLKEAYDLNAGRADPKVARSRRSIRRDDLRVQRDFIPIREGGLKPIIRPDAKAYEISYTLAFGKEIESLRPAEFERHLRNFDFSGDEDDLLVRAVEELQDGDQGLAKHLDGEEGWESWREGFKRMDDNGNFEFAMFIYCKLHHTD